MAKARAFVFTINNPAFPTEELPRVDRERYVSWQREIAPTTGTPHIQGYIELDAPVRYAHIHRAWPTAVLAVRRGTREQARDYTRKSESRDEGDDAGPFERGDFARGGSGARNDLADAVNTLREGGIAAVARENPVAFVKFSRGLRELERTLRERPRDDDFEPRPWQAHVLDWLQSDPDDRTIMWVTDTRGNNGKSRLARHLVLEHDAIQLEGKVADMAYLYDNQRIVIIDITRAQADNSKHLYSFAEKLKNGVVVSTKYECQTKVFKPPHVVFFSNQSWDPELWSEDRVLEVDLNNPDVHV